MSFTFEFESAASAPRHFNAGRDWHNLGPKLTPEKIVSGTVLEGDHKVGSIRQVNFAPGAPFSFIKERLDFVDEQNFESKITLIEGGGLGAILKSASTHIKFEPRGEGCVAKVTTTGEAMPGVDLAEMAEKAKANFTQSFKAVEAYLLANPDAYN